MKGGAASVSMVMPMALTLAIGPVLLTALWLALSPLLANTPWVALWQDPRFADATLHTLWTGTAASLLAWVSAGYLLRSAFIRGQTGRWLNRLPLLLATPHAAMAIAIVLWVAPTGWLLRFTSPWLTGFDTPPFWRTTQDPLGLGLIAALWIKEVPFLCWVAATQLQREDVRRRWQAEFAVAQTMGLTPTAAFNAVVWPQLARVLRWPFIAVLAYGLTVVDLALIIGPTAPPTLAVLAWEWLRDADAVLQAQGVLAAWVLAGLTLLVGASSWRPIIRIAPFGVMGRAIGGGWRLLFMLYAAAWLALLVGGFLGVWPFPSVRPEQWHMGHWDRVWDSAESLWRTVALGVLAATLTVAWLVAWLEWVPHRWQQVMRPLLIAPMILPPLLWAFGLYRVALWGHFEGAWFGMVVAHAIMAMPFALLALESVYRASDPRLQAVTLTLGRHPLQYLLSVKWPLLKRALWSAWAIAFAVSVAQYLPTLYIGAGRFVTVTTEAVAQATAGQRGLMSAYAALQTILPLMAFAVAIMLGRPRRFMKGLP